MIRPLLTGLICFCPTNSLGCEWVCCFVGPAYVRCVLRACALLCLFSLLSTRLVSGEFPTDDIRPLPLRRGFIPLTNRLPLNLHQPLSSGSVTPLPPQDKKLTSVNAGFRSWAGSHHPIWSVSMLTFPSLRRFYSPSWRCLVQSPRRLPALGDADPSLSF